MSCRVTKDVTAALFKLSYCLNVAIKSITWETIRHNYLRASFSRPIWSRASCRTVTRMGSNYLPLLYQELKDELGGCGPLLPELAFFGGSGGFLQNINQSLLCSESPLQSISHMKESQ